MLRNEKKLILDPRPDPDEHRTLISCRKSPTAHAYHVWLLPAANTLAHRRNQITVLALAE